MGTPSSMLFHNLACCLGAQVTVKSASLQILPEARKALVERMVPALQACFAALATERVTTMFEELPVENIAIGTHISVFGRKSLNLGREQRTVPDWDTSEGPSPH